MPITIEIVAANEDELKRMVASLAPIAFGEGHPMLTQPTHPVVMTTADGKVAAMVELAEDVGEATEADPSAPTEEDDAPVEVLPEETTAKRGRGRPAGAKNKPKDEAAPAAPAELDTEAAEKLRAGSIRTLTVVFHRSDAGKKAVKALQAKYGVTKFSDVELEFAAALAADAKALDEEVK